MRVLNRVDYFSELRVVLNVVYIVECKMRNFFLFSKRNKFDEKIVPSKIGNFRVTKKCGITFFFIEFENSITRFFGYFDFFRRTIRVCVHNSLTSNRKIIDFLIA